MNNVLLQNLIQLIGSHTGLHIREQDKQALTNKVNARMLALKLSTPEQYYQLLDTNIHNGSTNETQCDREWKALTLLLTTGESYFFRDKGQIALLKDSLLPQIIEQKKRSHYQQNSSKLSLRIWSAGCSTGEEVYSIAILVKELIPDLHNWHILILGTDINLESVAKAKQGIYDSWSFRMVEPQIIQRYFKPYQQSWKVEKTICSMVKFQSGNLIKDHFPQPLIDIYSMDIIICRNVFIYFDTTSISIVLNKFYHTLNTAGYLMTGHAELHGQNLDKLQTKAFSESLVYQRKDLAVIETPTMPVQLLSNFSNRNKQQNSLINQREIKPLVSPTKKQIKPETTKTAANLTTAENLFHQGDYPLAIQEAEQIIKQHPVDFDAYYLLAQAWANLGEIEKAAFYCERAIEINSLSTFPYYLLAHIAEEKGDASKAKKLLRKIIYITPTSVDAYLEMGDIYQREGDMNKAKKMRTTAFELLNQLPGHFLVEPSKNTVSELTAQVNKLLQNHR
ncbi:CheR family methyltransferase [Synechocystis sp. PCC 7509]|uniref:CheR family methyltransferase n=1 Tax=Synechocystis sp. PCC 7509 TaxID=927677 RepID=UPI0006853FFC|nr:CheR family methyltransferase [Synechocystis sp. PCC 7509]